MLTGYRLRFGVGAIGRIQTTEPDYSGRFTLLFIVVRAIIVRVRILGRWIVPRKEKALTRLEIIQAATRMFLEVGYSATSSRTLCSALNISPGTFTHYYPANEDILAVLIGMLADFQWKTVTETVNEGETLVSGIEYATLMKTSTSAPLETRISGAINTILNIYNVPDERRRQKIEKSLGMDYRRLGRKMLSDFKQYVSKMTETH